MPDASASEDLVPGSIVADRLRVVGKLGEGGMGAVYEVQHLHTKHSRALKILHPSYAARPDSVQRFLREASAAGRIGNEHIVDTYDAGQLPSGQPFIVMELLEGESLDELLRARGRLGVSETVRLLRQACDGAQAAHDAGIVHRDLKPQNLFVTTRNGEPFLKLLDFGISKFDPRLVDDHSVTSEGSRLGTPYYMSPEQLEGRKDVGKKSDIYALGILLYECASGQRPFEARSLPELSIRIHRGEYTPLEQLVPDLPPRFVEITRRAMHHDPEQRFASARELSEALSLVMTDEGLGQTIRDTTPTPLLEPRRRRSLWLIPAIFVVASSAWYLTSRNRGETAEKTQPSAAPVEETARETPTAQLPPAPSAKARADAAIPARKFTEPRTAPSATGAGSVRRSVEQKLQTGNPY